MSRGNSVGDICYLRSFYITCITKEMFDLKNEGEGQGVQHSQWCHSMVNINLYKSHMTHFSYPSSLLLKFRSSSGWTILNDGVRWRIVSYIQVIAHIFELPLKILNVSNV